FDNAVPCGSSVAIETLLRLTELTGEAAFETKATAALRPMGDLLGRHPSGFGRFLCALDFHVGPRVEVALVGAAGDGLQPLVDEVCGRFLPNRVVAGKTGASASDAERLPLLASRDAVGGRATAYVCRNFTCDLPATDRETLARQLDAL